jgi:hypothetical protein
MPRSGTPRRGACFFQFCAVDPPLCHPQPSGLAFEIAHSTRHPTTLKGVMAEFFCRVHLASPRDLDFRQIVLTRGN